MSKLQALTALRDKVKAGDVGYNGFLDIAELAFNRADVFSIDAWKAYNGSLDAAKALHEAVLPNMPVSIVDMTHNYLGGHGWKVSVNWPHIEWKRTFTANGPFSYKATNKDPARAWLLAILEALIAKEETDNG